MPFYKCSVLNELGKRESIVKEATDEVNLKAQLKNQKYHLVSYTKIVQKKPNAFFAVSSKIKKSEVILFLRQYAVMIQSGISIADALGALKKQHFSTPFKLVLIKLHDDVLSGKLLSEALSRHPECFPRFFCQMVSIGEVSGSIDKVLSDMADYYESDQRTKKKASSALVYPIVLLVMIFVVIIFLSVVVLPQFSNMFVEFSSNGSGAEIPKITQIIMKISDFINGHLLEIFTVPIAIAMVVGIFFTTPIGAEVKDTLKVKLPIIGGISTAVLTSRFTKAFVILLQSGMNITDCMENLTRIFDNKVYANKFAYCIKEVKRGKKLAPSIEKAALFPPMLTEMISVGEKSGELEETLQSTAGYFDDQVSVTIAKATSLLEPLMIGILGVVVAIVLLSVYLPMMDLMNTI